MPSDVDFTPFTYRFSISSKRLQKVTISAASEVSARDAVHFQPPTMRLAYLRRLCLPAAAMANINAFAPILAESRQSLIMLDLSAVTVHSLDEFVRLTSIFPPDLPNLDVIVLPQLDASMAGDGYHVHMLLAFFFDPTRFPLLSQLIGYAICGGPLATVSCPLPEAQISMRHVALPQNYVPTSGSFDKISFQQLESLCFHSRRTENFDMIFQAHVGEDRDIVNPKLYQNKGPGFYWARLAHAALSPTANPPSYVLLATAENAERAVVLHDPICGMRHAHILFAFALSQPSKTYAWHNNNKFVDISLLSLVDPKLIAHQKHHIAFSASKVGPLMRRTLQPFSVVAEPFVSIYANCIMACGIPHASKGYRAVDLNFLHHLILPNYLAPQAHSYNTVLLDESRNRTAAVSTETPWLIAAGVQRIVDVMRDNESGVTLLMLSLSSVDYPLTGYSWREENAAYDPGASLCAWLLKNRVHLRLDVNETDSAGNTALHYACDVASLFRTWELAELFSAGADLSIRNRAGIAPFQLLPAPFFEKSPDVDPELEALFFKMMFPQPFFNPTKKHEIIALVSLPMLNIGNEPLLMVLIRRNYPLFSALLDKLPPQLDVSSQTRLAALRNYEGSTLLRSSLPFLFVSFLPDFLSFVG